MLKNDGAVSAPDEFHDFQNFLKKGLTFGKWSDIIGVLSLLASFGAGEIQKEVL